MNWIKILKINFLVTLGLLVIIEASLTVAYHFRDYYLINSNADEKILAPNLTSETIGFKNETKNFHGYPYKAFLGWVSPDIQGELLNVTNGRRLTVESKELVGNEVVHLFGGSTIWGYSVSDKHTIPSLISKNLNLKAINYGEQAYNSRQEINLLLDNLDLIQKDDMVIFYDGVNDVYHNCRSHNSPNGHVREYYFRDVLNSNSSDTIINFSFIESLSTSRFLHGLANRYFSKKESVSKKYLNACADPIYAANVASFLVKNWEAAEAILIRKGVKFMCVLQPNPYTFNGSITYSSEEIKSQVEIVYPIIRQKAKTLSCFHDYSTVLTEDNYVDSCCHLNRFGNSQVSAQLSVDISRKLGFK